jgi:hypothetical protein
MLKSYEIFLNNRQIKDLKYHAWDLDKPAHRREMRETFKRNGFTPSFRVIVKILLENKQLED